MKERIQKAKFYIIDKVLSGLLRCLSILVHRFDMRENETLKNIIRKLLHMRINNILAHCK